ncbi:hypothetical protein MMC12_000383 [Toensbergia leucococca]|nr:hypothetical protein [Toensbergia leucococca]
MPPKKKARLSSLKPSPSTHSTPKQRPSTPHTPTAPPSTNAAFFPTDPWTDEQETSLFKGIIKWKPVGMHKHFRMIALSQYLRNHGYTSPRDTHTRIPGIWSKLGALYNLDALDERENSGEADYEDHPTIPTSTFPFRRFTLPDSDFGAAMFERRLAPEGSESPPTIPLEQGADAESAGRASTVAESVDDARSSPASVGGGAQKAGSVGRAKGRGTRASLLQMEVKPSEGSVGKEEEGSEEGEEEEEEVVESPKEVKNTSRTAAANAKRRGVAGRRGRRRR